MLPEQNANRPPAAWLAALKLRILRREDLPALEWDGEYTHFRRLYQDVYQSASRGSAVMWVAELPEAGIIGQLFVQLNSARRDLADGVRRAYLYGFRIKPQYRRFGAGSRLLQAAEEDLVRRKFTSLTLNVGKDNPAALRFYERHAYHVVGAEPGIWSYVDHMGMRREVNEPAWRMEKSLAG